MALNPRIEDWRGKRVWLIGGSTGIGEALARALASRGAMLAISARNAKRLSSVVGRLPGDHLALALDATDVQQIKAARDRLIGHWGEIDLLIFNAGTYHPMRAWELSREGVRDTLSINLLAAFDAVEAVLPAMLAKGAGGVALVASVAGYAGLPKATVYGPGKAALINLAEVLHLDLAPRGLGVWLINPGFVKTPLTAQNDFHMPALISAERAAEEIMSGFASGTFEIHFPKRFTRFMKLLRSLPYRFYFPLIRRTTST